MFYCCVLLEIKLTTTTTHVTLKNGVPRGSELDPILFTMHTTPRENIIRKHGLNFHFNAEDTQLCISFQPGVSVSKETAISCLEACIKDIKMTWMTNNLLKLNDDRTELIVITTHSNISQNQHIGINIGDSLITPSSDPPRNLEFYLTRLVVSMTMYLKFAKASIITCIPLGKFGNILIPQLLRKW